MMHLCFVWPVLFPVSPVCPSFPVPVQQHININIFSYILSSALEFFSDYQKIHSWKYSERKGLIARHEQTIIFSLSFFTDYPPTNWSKADINWEREQTGCLRSDACLEPSWEELTGYGRLRYHVYNQLKIGVATEHICGTGGMTAQHVLQDCPAFKSQRRHTWPSAVPI